MSSQAADVKERIDALDNKQAIHIANALVQAAFTTASTFANLDDEALLARVVNEVQAFDKGGELTMICASPDWAAMPSDGQLAGELARRGLQALAEQPGGNALVAEALDKFFDAQADFGVLSAAAAVGFVWLILSGEIEFKIGAFSYKKKGLTSDAQAKLAPSFIRGLGSSVRAGLSSG